MSPSKAPTNDPEKEPVAIALVIKGLSILIVYTLIYYKYRFLYIIYFLTITFPVKLESNSNCTSFDEDAEINPGNTCNLFESYICTIG